jgi:hypothetical protein
MPIFAYLDPVTGSALIQMLLGALAVAGLGWQYLRKGAFGLLNRFRKVDKTSESELQEVPESF